MAVGSDFIQTLKDKLNIVDVIQGYVHLERLGDNWWGCCPFHHEKTPSFSVSANKQFYHCFGCGVSGDVIRFVSDMESVDFMESVRILADKAKLPVPDENFDPEKNAEKKRKRTEILRILNDTAHFYLDNLNSGKAEEHIAYILERKIPSNIVRSFGLGASLDYDSLPKYLRDKGYSMEDVLDSGVVYESGGKYTDSQAGRLIFPIISAYGDVVAFGGRTLAKPQPGAPYAKYKNTKETVVFTKRRSLYNINKLKSLKKEKSIPSVIIVEGYMDVLSLYSAGIKNVVASMGTSLTREQASLVKRYTGSVLISYDADSAGEDATIRGLDIFREEGIDVKVVKLPEGYDPDEVIKKLGRDVYLKCLEDAVPLIDYKLEVAGKGKDLTKAEGRREYVASALKVIRTADSAAEQEELLRNLSKATGITYESLNRDLGKRASATPPMRVRVVPGKDKKADAVTEASRFVCAAYLFEAKYAEGDPTGVPYVHDVHSMIATLVKASKEMYGRAADITEILDLVEENTPEYEEMNKVLEYSFGGRLTEECAGRSFSDCMRQLEKRQLQERIYMLNIKYNAATLKEEKDRIAVELNEVTRKLKKL
ncbi:MAG: DNA primase [Clostridia bacterium]|nr:DNA primase [Clostridia bacterium]